MNVEPSFKPVLTDLVDPELKLRITNGRFDVDSSTISIEIFYDPALSRENLTMPMPPILARIWTRHNSGPAPAVVFESGDSHRITSVLLEVREEYDQVKLKVVSDGEGLSYKAALIEQSGGNSFIAQGYNIVFEIIKSAIILPEWESVYTDAKKVSIYINRSLAQELARTCGFTFDGFSEDDILVAERGVRK
ncbi:UNVERIFIED_ORG: hypothetical protein LHK14_23735 (plasmid) [Roseateles sp. XES5]|nr:hypothetical protein [Roseateles sp. XES5]